jgi:3-hydroxyisobutyrate dehydrogenase-like beta-hydroxyacid dehydrogenase
MGTQMARRLIDHGHRLHVWNRSPLKASSLVDAGAVLCESPADAASAAEVTVTMVADPEALRAVTEGPHGVAAGVAPPAAVIEMSTVGPAAISRLASVLPHGVALLDCPVLGSLAEAQSGALTVLAGGPRKTLDRWHDVLSTFGSVLQVGDLGAGAAAKLVVNLALLETLCVLGEALALADALDLDRTIAYQCLERTPIASQVERRREALETDSYPPRFSLPLARKDAELISQAARETGVELRLGEATRRWFAEADESVTEERDYSSVLAHILARRKPQ